MVPTRLPPALPLWSWSHRPNPSNQERGNRIATGTDHPKGGTSRGRASPATKRIGAREVGIAKAIKTVARVLGNQGGKAAAEREVQRPMGSLAPPSILPNSKPCRCQN